MFITVIYFSINVCKNLLLEIVEHIAMVIPIYILLDKIPRKCFGSFWNFSQTKPFHFTNTYTRFTLAYLLVMEAVLEPRHKWTLLDGNTYYCHIGAYQIYIWRCTWMQNIWMQIFMDQEINDAMIHPKGPNSSCRRMLVYDHLHMSTYLRDFDSDPEQYEDVAKLIDIGN